MRSSFLRNAAIALGIIVFAAVIPGFGEDYLVIKKKGGPTQKIPLEFSPENIESFHVESAPTPGGTEGTREPTPGMEEFVQPGSPKPQAPTLAPSEPKPMQIRPGAPAILRDTQEPAAKREYAPPSLIEQTPRRESAAPTKRPGTGPVAAEASRGMGSFYANIYKLPPQIKALPDYSAFRPQKTISTDRINLEPSKGDLEQIGRAHV
jgi:hypothetical protein